jgi:hypothetical protein
MAALMGAGAFAVHQLRFLLAFGHDSGAVLAKQGHAYLVTVAPLVVWLLLAVFAHLLWCSARGVPARAPRGRRLWAGASAALLAAYCAQELIEGMVAAGHPAGFAGLAGGGGWLALPLSAAFGLVIALLMRGAAAAPAALAARRPWSAPRPTTPLRVPAPPVRPLGGSRVFAVTLPARGPPAASV